MEKSELWVTTQNKYYFRVNKQITWLASEMLNSF